MEVNSLENRIKLRKLGKAKKTKKQFKYSNWPILCNTIALLKTLVSIYSPLNENSIKNCRFTFIMNETVSEIEEQDIAFG